MTNYSRQNKKTNKDNQESGKAGRHIKKGLSAFQKTVTLIGSVLGIITATITIMNAMKSNEQKNQIPVLLLKRLLLSRKSKRDDYCIYF